MAAHITAASADGPRYDHELSVDVRRAAANGIWLCQSCAKLVDNDEERYTVERLRRWKTITETAALRALENRGSDDDELLFLRLEEIMPDFLDEIRKDLAARPLSREFVVLKRIWNYPGIGHELRYYYDDHAELENILIILQNHGLIRDITRTNMLNDVKRYAFTEALARYFGA